MDFKQAAKLGSFLSKDYAEGLFRLLATYMDISASEAASRLNLHIKTVQDFLEAMASFNILEKTEVFERKRPYFRYSLKAKSINMQIDLNPLIDNSRLVNDDRLKSKIKEKRNAGVIFTTARNNQYISSVTYWIGEGREKRERKLNLSIPQGKFLYHLPFPSADSKSIQEIMQKAEVDDSNVSEIIDIVNELIRFKVIETK